MSLNKPLPTLVFALAALGFTVLNVAAQQPFNLSAPALPNPSITPGDALSVTAKDICVSGYSKKVRNVPQSVKEQAYKNYGISHREKGEYEVDHLISLELGGSNSIKNLWPESYETRPWNAHVKDKLENAFHSDICSGRIDIKVAQQKMASNWITAFKDRFPDDPLSKLPTPGTPGSGLPAQPPEPHQPEQGHSSPNPDGQVWVNTKSGTYWKPGTRYYGKTKQGKYMTETEAIKAGYHAAGGQ